MNAIGGFIVRLLSNLIEMPQAIITQVVGTNPASALLVAVGTVFVLGAVGVFGYVLLGALGVPLPSPGRGPSES